MTFWWCDFIWSTFGPGMDLPVCPGTPCWPGSPRSPCMVRAGELLSNQLMITLLGKCFYQAAQLFLHEVSKNPVSLEHNILFLAFGPEGPGIPGGPCNPRMPLWPWSPCKWLQQTSQDEYLLSDEYNLTSVLPFPPEYQFLELLQVPSNQANQVHPEKGEVIISKKKKQNSKLFFQLKRFFFPYTKLDLPSALVLHPLLEDQGGPQYQLLQVLPVNVRVICVWLIWCIAHISYYLNWQVWVSAAS